MPISTDMIYIIVGAIMVFGGLASAASGSGSSSDENFGLLLLIMGIAAIVIGTDSVDFVMEKVNEMGSSDN